MTLPLSRFRRDFIAAFTVGVLFSLGILASVATFAGEPTVSGQAATVRFLPTPDSALQEMIDTIRSARNQLDLEYYIVAPCSLSTSILLDELKKKFVESKQQGRVFRVRLLMDFHPFHSYHPDRHPEDLAKLFSELGAEVKIYNPTRFPNPRANERDHRKLMIADGIRGITGGRNIGDDYFALSSYANYIDRDVSVEGPPAAAMQASFELFWNDSRSRPPQELHSMVLSEKRVDPRSCLDLDDRIQEITRELQNRRARNERVFPRFRCGAVQFISDRPHSFTDPRKLSKAILAELNKAEKKVLAENYTYLPEGPFVHGLSKMSWRGVSVQWLTNSYGTAHMENWTGLAHYRRMVSDHSVKRNIRVVPTMGDKGMSWLSPGEGHSPFLNTLAQSVREAYWPIHSKVFSIDGKTAIIGSFNVDARSRMTNSEAALFVSDCPEFMANVDHELEALRAVSISIEEAEEQRLRERKPGSKQATFFERALDNLLSELLFGYL